MFKSKISTLIDEAVEECITYGRGLAYDIPNKIKIVAEWAENEKDIKISILENRIVRFSYTEKVM